jgi:cytochrome c-type biogenesis protein CcmF
MWQSLPDFGTAVVLAVLVLAGYSFGLAAAAAGARPRLLPAARKAAYGTVALCAVAVLVLAYAFVTHDFRIRYVAHYSDRSMSTGYLLSSLWGGQDGSLLWWLFLLALYVGACLRWMKGRYLSLQPYVIATLMAVVGFFAVLMLFSANPFSTTLSGGRVDGDGLNPLLQNFYMAFHPPSLYAGFVGCTIPFAFAIAALVSGRLGEEWIVAVRKWMLFAWLFLSIGNALGMLWAYVELGWGGYWAWDPVENASFLPWLSATAYVHSTMIQERRGMLKVWNLFLICLTFFLTIFGTFLTRSGVISSVHAFAQSNIGSYFVWFLAIVVAGSAGLIVWRLPLLRSEARIESALSREAAFVANNWALLGAVLFVLVATTFPMISKALLSEAVTVGPTFYNRWMVPLGLAVLLLMGVAPLLGWRKTSRGALARAFVVPSTLAALAAIGLLVFGKRLGFAPLVAGDLMVAGATGALVRAVGSAAPLVTFTFVVFNLAVIAQEFQRGVAGRMRGSGEGVAAALFGLVRKARRRYGGYVVHVGIALMYLGFLGQAWGANREASLRPGASVTAERYTLRYVGQRTETDANKRMVFADLQVLDADGHEVGKLSPAKFFYRKNPEQPTTEVAVLHSVREDLYVVLGSVAPETGLASLQVHLNPMVSWIWLGVLVLILGASVSLWPEVSLSELRAFGALRLASTSIATLLAALLVALLAAATPARAALPFGAPPLRGALRACAQPAAGPHDAGRPNLAGHAGQASSLGPECP